MVYIASKYHELTTGGRLRNVHKSFDAAKELYQRSEHNLVPYSPLWTHFLDERIMYTDSTTRSNEWWYAFDNSIIPKMDALLKLTKPGESKGADLEEQLANSLKIPVFYSIEEILQWTD